MRIGHVIVLGLALCACAQKRSQPVARTASPPPAAPLAPAADPSAQAGEEKEKRPRLGEAAVYVDGKSVGVLRLQELPSKLPAHVLQLGEGYQTTQYSLTEYITSLGVDAKKVREAHLYGGSRVVVVDRAELTRIGAEIMFSFSHGDRGGKPRIHFPPKKLNVNTTIDMLSGMAFYVEKEPPTLKDGGLVMPDGTSATGKVPYAPEEQGSGTRVYVDGALVGTVKRKKLTNDLAVPSTNDGDPTKFSLVAYATKLGADTKGAKSIDLIAGDEVVAHLAPEKAKSITFQVPSRNRGQALVDVPQGEGTRPARVSAIQIFVKTKAPVRAVVPLDDADDAAPSAGGGVRSGPPDRDEEP